MRRSKNRPLKWNAKADFIYVDVQRSQATSTDDSFGEDSGVTWETLYSNVKCQFESTTQLTAGNLGMTEAGLISVSEYLMIFETKWDIKARDRIVDIDGNTYRVNDVRPYGTHKEAYCDVVEID